MTGPIRVVSNGPGVPAVIGDGLSNSDGVQGFSANSNCAGVLGTNSQAGVGVKGVSEKQDGVQGFAKDTNHFGVIGDNQNGVGVRGQSINHDGVQGVTSNKDRAGVVGTNTGDGNGVLGQCDHSAGVLATSKFGTGILARGGRYAAQFVGEVDVAGNLYVTGALTVSGSSVVASQQQTQQQVTGLQQQVTKLQQEVVSALQYARSLDARISVLGG